jgi:hypothetical protein
VHRRLAVIGQTDDLDLVANLDDATLDTAGRHGPTTLDREHVFDGHQEWLVHFTLGSGMKLSTASSNFAMHLAASIGWVVQRGQRRTADDRGVVAGEVVLAEQLAHLELDQVEQLFVVDQVAPC